VRNAGTRQSLGSRKAIAFLDGWAVENDMKKQIISVGMAVLLAFSWTVRVSAEGGSVPAATVCYLAVIQDIQPDGTLVLDNQRKVKLPSKVFDQHDQIRPGEEIVILTRAGMMQLDPDGRILGTMLVLDSAGKAAASRGPSREDLLSTKTSMASQGYDKAARSTVAPPVGMGLQLFREEAAMLMTLGRESGLAELRSPDLVSDLSAEELRGGTLYLENGREIRMPRNVFRFPAAVKAQHRLLFCAK